ncbi:MAG: glycoside hydrolase family 1 protein [Bdellovibrionales bacterium]|nr:glycoside hydrolase family 1 protein [Bdellovibrionales bacterium]
MKHLLTLVLIFSAAAHAQLTPELVQGLPTKSSGFMWGVANAAFQVEGSPAPSDWTDWVKKPGTIVDGTTGDRGTDFWNRYDEDFKLAQELGSNTFRISIAWERLVPAPGQWNEAALAHYEKMIVAMRARGLEPVVTLHHYTLPQWLADEGGILAKDFVNQFAAYSVRVVRRLSASPARVTWWMTFNEPMVLCNASYVSGEWPPGKKGDFQGAIKAAANLARAHIEAVRRIRAEKLPIKMSIAKHWRLFEGKPGDITGGPLAKTVDWAFNRQILTALTTGKLNFWMPGALWPENDTIALPEKRSTLDYIGLNYYGRTFLGTKLAAPFFELSEGPGPKSDIGWEMYPEGMYLALKDAAQYKLPILISENGVADAQDRFREEYIRSHLFYMAKAMREGVNVIGYLHWTLTDNFEWAKGLTPRFGLVEIDYSHNLARKPRPSFEYMKQFYR